MGQQPSTTCPGKETIVMGLQPSQQLAQAGKAILVGLQPSHHQLAQAGETILMKLQPSNQQPKQKKTTAIGLPLPHKLI